MHPSGCINLTEGKIMNTNLMLSTSATEHAVSIMLTGKTLSERKMSALECADLSGIVAISHGKGKAAKVAADMKRDAEVRQIAVDIGSGNFQAFAVAVAARTGQAVRFGEKADGRWIRKPSEDFRAFGGTLRHAMLQLEAKGKAITPKGDPTAAAADIMYLQSLHAAALRVLDARAEADRLRVEAQKAELEIELQAEKTGELVAA